MRGLRLIRAMAAGIVCVATMSAHAGAPETFTATATVKTAGGAAATAPVVLTVDRATSPADADALRAAFKTGGAAGLRKALARLQATGSITVAGGVATPTRITIERATDKGRLITAVTDTPILHLGAGLPGAKTKEGYDFAVLDLEVMPGGSGSGTFTPAARVALQGGAFVVDGYSSEPLRLTAVTVKK